MNQLNPDVYAGDILRSAYRSQMDLHSQLARTASELRDDLERIEARRRTAAERAASLMETLTRHGGMLPPVGSDAPDTLDHTLKGDCDD